MRWCAELTKVIKSEKIRDNRNFNMDQFEEVFKDRMAEA